MQRASQTRLLSLSVGTREGGSAGERAESAVSQPDYNGEEGSWRCERALKWRPPVDSKSERKGSGRAGGPAGLGRQAVGAREGGEGERSKWQCGCKY